MCEPYASDIMNCSMRGCNLRMSHTHGTDVAYGEDRPRTVDYGEDRGWNVERPGTLDHLLLQAYQAGVADQAKWRAERELGVTIDEPSRATLLTRFATWRSGL